MATRKTKAERDLDAAIELHYKRLATGKSINVLDITKVYARARAAHAEGKSVEASIAASIAEFCKGER